MSGGSGGGTDFYGLNGSNAAYVSKGGSSLSAASANWSVSVSGYASYQLTDHVLAAGTCDLDDRLRSARAGPMLTRTPRAGVVVPAALDHEPLRVHVDRAQIVDDRGPRGNVDAGDVVILRCRGA